MKNPFSKQNVKVRNNDSEKCVISNPKMEYDFKSWDNLFSENRVCASIPQKIFWNNYKTKVNGKEKGEQYCFIASCHHHTPNT